MPITLEKLADEPIIVVTMTNPLDIKQDVPELARLVTEAYEAAEGPIWDVTDTRDLTMPFGDIVSGLAMMTREFAFVKHPNAAGYVIVANNDLIRLAGKALGQSQYGGIRAVLKDSMEEALAYAREQIAAGQAP